MACNYLHMFLKLWGDVCACDCMHLAWVYIGKPIVLAIAGPIHTAALEYWALPSRTVQIAI